jgi:L-iditol 2-dehydrogenase
MVEPVAVALHAVNLTDICIGDTAVVGGAGMIALFVIQLLKRAGCGQIIAFDIDQDRLELAKRLGATHIYRADTDAIPEEVKKLTHGRGADVGFEVVGISSVLKNVVSSVRKGGAVTLVGNVSPTVEIPLQQIVTGQLKLQGSCAICGEYEPVLDLISRNQIAVDPLISAVTPLAEGARWFDRLYRREKGLMKVILKPTE